MPPQQRTRLLNFIDEAYVDAITERWATAILSQIDCAEPPACLISKKPIVDAATGRVADDVVAIVEERDGLCHAFMFKQRHLEEWFLARFGRLNPATNRPVDDAYSCLIPLSLSLYRLDNALHDYLAERGDDALSEDDLPVCVRDLLTAGACVDVVRSAHDRPRLYPLVIAACRGNIAVVRCLVETFSATVNAIDDTGFSVLEHAALLGHAAVVRYLIEHGAVVQADYEDCERGVNALRMAALGGHLSLVVDLIDEFNADIDFHVPYVVSSALAGAAHGHLDIVQELVRRGAKVDIKQVENPLVIAAFEGHLDIVQYLVVEARAQVDFADADGFTPLTAASAGGHLDVVEFLLASGAQVDLGDGPQPLIQAAYFGHLDVVRLFVERDRTSINSSASVRDACALASGAHKDHLDVFEDEMCYFEECCPVLDFEAAGNGGARIIRYSVRRGAARHIYFASAGCKSAALAAAVARGHLDVVQWLIGHGADVNPGHGAVPMVEAAANGHVDVVRILLDKGARLDRCKRGSYCPLSVAARAGHANVVELLCSRGASVYAAAGNVSCSVAINEAAERGHVDVVGILLDNGGQLDRSNCVAYCPLIVAAKAGHANVVELLCLRRASMYATAGNVLCWVAMQQAVERGHVDVVGALLRLPNLDVNARSDTFPLTMIQMACTSSSPDSVAICRLLLDAGADVNATGSIKAVPAPLLIAASTGSLDLVELLVGAGADLLVKNAERQTALMIAASKGRADLVSYLLGRLLADRRIPARRVARQLAKAKVAAVDGDHVAVIGDIVEKSESFATGRRPTSSCAIQ
ncbi:Ankyrin repeat domain-containing protein [Plasmodiophora brassicae]|uniref:Uncharacterized protein n=1 Tax=Plasmodiophora brassicae TaxID=37360 RepID=A0A0G4J260_PLABS|nr:hypothetical protein PBRA_008645 [Plasmodiophora brassicae]SPQ98517.1 unnamed protein product [Plasmodiophora brassicae]